MKQKYQKWKLKNTEFYYQIVILGNTTEFIIIQKSHTFYTNLAWPPGAIFRFSLLNQYFEILEGINILKSFWKKAPNLWP